MDSQHSLGFVATLVAKKQHVSDVAGLLAGAVTFANEEDGTQTWFAFRGEGERFGVFDTFRDRADRQRHAEGKIVEAVNKHENWFVFIDITKVNIIGSKVSTQRELAVKVSDLLGACADLPTELQDDPRLQVVFSLAHQLFAAGNLLKTQSTPVVPFKAAETPPPVKHEGVGRKF